ncbi:hypothetical protein [Streptomyces sp. NPDC059063]|uniref:hypothetical protein n=1 Tax=Streptomyces sp. NPDC059063 TaxID=3346712 RepID=UPI00369AF733
MGLRDFARSLKGGDDHALARQISDKKKADDEKAAQQRRASHRARVFRDGDAAGQPFPRHLFKD